MVWWSFAYNPYECTSVFHVRDENLPNMSSDWLIRSAWARFHFGFIAPTGVDVRPRKWRRGRCGLNPETYLCMPFRSFSLPDAFLACVSSFIVAQTIAQTRVFDWMAGGLAEWKCGVLGDCGSIPHLWHAHAHFHFT